MILAATEELVLVSFFPLIASSLKKQFYLTFVPSLVFVRLMLFFNLSYDMFLSKCVFIYFLVVINNNSSILCYLQGLNNELHSCMCDLSNVNIV